MDVDVFSTFFALLALVALAFVVGTIGLALAARVSDGAARVAREARAWLGPSALTLAWVVAAVATAGSLSYSEVAGYTPCKLCWYQRIAMYPQVLVLGIAALRRDVGVRRYLIPLSAAGGLISIYHYQLERFPAQASFSCTLDAPCTITWVWKFHFISIPMMALIGFAAIVALLAIARAPGAGEPTSRAPVLEREEILR